MSEPSTWPTTPIIRHDLGTLMSGIFSWERWAAYGRIEVKYMETQHNHADVFIRPLSTQMYV